MNTIYFSIYLSVIVNLGVMSVVNAEIPRVNPSEPNSASDLRCIQLRNETIDSREACARKAYQALECQFHREVQTKGLLNAQLERMKVKGQSKAMDVLSERSRRTGKTTRVEILSYGFFDRALSISISARATWWADEKNCVY